MMTVQGLFDTTPHAWRANKMLKEHVELNDKLLQATREVLDVDG